MKVQISDKRFSLNTIQKTRKNNGKSLVKMTILNRVSCCIFNQFKYSHYIVQSLQGTTGYLTLIEWSYKATITADVYIRISVNKVDLQQYCA